MTPRFPVKAIGEFTIEVLDEMEVDREVAEGETIWQRNRRVSGAIMDWLEENCLYTTDLRDFVQIAGEDPIESFLTRYRFGHCEYFASALTAMCRSVGIESRLVTGYVAIEYDEGIERYIVRESNAHAWSEVRTGPYQWTGLDPSPICPRGAPGRQPVLVGQLAVGVRPNRLLLELRIVGSTSDHRRTSSRFPRAGGGLDRPSPPSVHGCSP